MEPNRLLKKGDLPKLVAYVVAGDPSLEVTELSIEELIKNGVDILELGVPFTDAMADGPVIQAASERAAKKGITLTQVLALSAKLRKKHASLGIVLFTYFNPIFKMGIEPFARAAALSGVDAVLTVDLPPEEAVHYRSVLDAHQIGTVFLASPTTSSERMKIVDQASSSFVYYVSRAGVTGVQSQLSSTLEKELIELRAQIKKPIAVGFGISTGAQVRKLVPFVDAVVVGSAFVKILGSAEKDVHLRVGALARELKEATKT